MSELAPVDSPLVVREATPLESVPEPSNVVPLKKLTRSPFVVVVGGPTVKGDSAAVNVTDCPVKIPVFGE